MSSEIWLHFFENCIFFDFCSTSHSGGNQVDGLPPATILKQLQLVTLRSGPAPIGTFEVENCKIFRHFTITFAVRSNQVLNRIVMLRLVWVSCRYVSKTLRKIGIQLFKKCQFSRLLLYESLRREPGWRFTACHNAEASSSWWLVE